MTDYLEKQYAILDSSQMKHGLYTLGPMASFTWNDDPKRLLFVLSRYKFVARMLEGSKSVIEIGCGDGFGSRIVRQHVEYLLLTDADQRMIDFALQSDSPTFNVDALCHNFVEDKLAQTFKFDGAYLVDVLEHIPLNEEVRFFSNIMESLVPNAIVVVGMPSIESQVYASPGSKEGHVNCKTKEGLGLFLSTYFETVMLFSMNDEVVHTGFSRMSNYIFAVCSVPKFKV